MRKSWCWISGPSFGLFLTQCSTFILRLDRLLDKISSEFCMKQQTTSLNLSWKHLCPLFHLRLSTSLKAHCLVLHLVSWSTHVHIQYFIVTLVQKLLFPDLEFKTCSVIFVLLETMRGVASCVFKLCIPQHAV